MSHAEPNPRLALAGFGVTATIAPHPPGFSGASVWRVRIGCDSYALKAYPRTFGNADRLASIHNQLRQARARGIEFVPRPLAAPDGRSVVAKRDQLWDLVSWLPGSATLSTDPTPIHIGSALRALAHLHRVWRCEENLPAPCPAVVRRLAALVGWDSVRRVTPTVDGPYRELMGHALALLPALTSEARRALEPWRHRPVRVQTTFGDLWQAHVLFEGQSVSGLIDHAAIKIDHVVADVARLIGSLGHVDIASLSGPDGDVLAAYEAACPLQANELALVDALLATGPAVQLTQWARWLLVERRTFPDCGAVSRRLAFLVEQGRKCLERAKLVH